MNFIKSMTVAQKLFAIIAIAVTVATVQAGIGLFELSKSRDSLKTVYEDRMVPVSYTHLDVYKRQLLTH